MYRTERGAAMLQAHRGVSTDCPENTMAAFRAAVAQGYEIIELDPTVTADGRFVILHDKTVNRTGRKSDGTALAAQLCASDASLEELLGLDFGLWFDESFSGERIPTLREVLAFSKETGITLKLDNKLQGFSREGLGAFFDEVEAYSNLSLIGFTCSDIEFLRRVAARFPGVAIHYDGPVDRERLDAVRAALRDNPLTVWLRYDNKLTAWCKNPAADTRLCALAKEYGRIGLWLLSEEEEAKAAIDLFGADVIETTGAIKPRDPAE